MRGVALLVAGLVACGGANAPVDRGSGRPAPDGTPAPGPGAYPIEWARELPDGFLVRAVYDYYPSGDALLVGELRGDVRLSGAAFSPDEGYEHAIARIDAADGLQVWVAGTRKVAGLGFDDTGYALWVGEARGAYRQLARIDGETGARTLLMPPGSELLRAARSESLRAAPIVDERFAAVEAP